MPRQRKQAGNIKDTWHHTEDIFDSFDNFLDIQKLSRHYKSIQIVRYFEFDNMQLHLKEAVRNWDKTMGRCDANPSCLQ